MDKLTIAQRIETARGEQAQIRQRHDELQRMIDQAQNEMAVITVRNAHLNGLIEGLAAALEFATVKETTDHEWRVGETERAALHDGATFS